MQNEIIESPEVGDHVEASYKSGRVQAKKFLEVAKRFSDLMNSGDNSNSGTTVYWRFIISLWKELKNAWKDLETAMGETPS